MQTTQQLNETNFGMNQTDELLIQIEEYSGIPFYASLNAYFIAKLYQPIQKRRIFRQALQSLRTKDASDGCCYKLRKLKPGADYETLWVIQNEDSITFKFPEDN